MLIGSFVAQTYQSFITRRSHYSSVHVTFRAPVAPVIRSGLKPPASCKAAMQIINDIIVCVFLCVWLCVRHTHTHTLRLCVLSSVHFINPLCVWTPACTNFNNQAFAALKQKLFSKIPFIQKSHEQECKQLCTVKTRGGRRHTNLHVQQQQFRVRVSLLAQQNLWRFFPNKVQLNAA